MSGNGQDMVLSGSRPRGFTGKLDYLVNSTILSHHPNNDLDDFTT